MKSFCLVPVILAGCVSLISCSSTTSQGRNIVSEQSWIDPVASGMEQLYRLDQAARFHSSTQIGSFSSYDHSGGNNDGFGGEYSYIGLAE